MTVSLTLKNIRRLYVKDNEEFAAVDNVNLEVKPGEFLTFLGPSGCGKTTTLRTITGFIEPAEGQVFVRDKARQRARSGVCVSELRAFPAHEDF